MPTYDYLCKKCNKVTEIFARISEKIEECPNCGSKGFMKRLIGPGAQVAMDITREVTYERDQQIRRREQIMKMPAEDRREFRQN